MIIMTQTKLLHPLNSKANRIQFYVSFVLIVIGLFAIFSQYNFEIAYTNKHYESMVTDSYYKVNNVEYDIKNGLWTIPLILGILLFCNIFMPMDLSNKKIKKEIIKYYRYKKKELSQK